MTHTNTNATSPNEPETPPPGPGPGLDRLVCEGCGAIDTLENPLMNWLNFKSVDKIMCTNCTNDDIDNTYRQIGFSETEIKAHRANRERKE